MKEFTEGSHKNTNIKTPNTMATNTYTYYDKENTLYGKKLSLYIKRAKRLSDAIV